MPAASMTQEDFVVPNLTIKDLLGAIPPHCFERSALRSSSYIVWDLAVIASLYKAAVYAETFVNPATLSLPHALCYPFARFAIWSLYGFGAGLFGTGLWIIAHECGHQAFSESKRINNAVGWVLHSALSVPYHSWRISHAKHHASTSHMTQDQAYVPRTRTDLGLQPLDPRREDRLGSRVTEEVKKELTEALGDSPLITMLNSLKYLVVGWPAYLLFNASGQRRYPAGTNHISPSAAIFAPHHYGQILISDIGVLLWWVVLGIWMNHSGLLEVFRTYLVPYLWVNHWIVLITFLQHTDPLLPHYRTPEFTFPRGALSTLDRSLLGDCGKLMGWLGAHATHGISETHVLHHVSSKIPHYHAWEASAALKKRLAQAGIVLEGAPGGWAELYRVYKECRFVEDEGDIVFYKNAQGVAKARPVLTDSTSDSGVDI
ncbi:delta-12 fatty acid desaturase protein [Infundibulicybe gibba]|nr:delta-12 fatty acid desaturase protein [Infundibulicybe gibba]